MRRVPTIRSIEEIQAELLDPNGMITTGEAAALIAHNDSCLWKWDDFSCTYTSACDNMFFFDTGTMTENNFTHCPYCGRRAVDGQTEDGK